MEKPLKHLSLAGFSYIEGTSIVRYFKTNFLVYLFADFLNSNLKSLSLHPTLKGRFFSPKQLSQSPITKF